MPIGWFIVPYKRLGSGTPAVRYCEMDDYTSQIVTAGGKWAESECLGNHAVVKVNASNAVLNALNNVLGFTRLPPLETTLGELTANQRNALRDKVLALGYPQSEIDTHLGTGAVLLSRTIRDIGRFILRRRLKPRYDWDTDTIVFDETIQECKPLDTIDEEVV